MMIYSELRSQSALMPDMVLANNYGKVLTEPITALYGNNSKKIFQQEVQDHM
jgi:hypothetical protein